MSAIIFDFDGTIANSFDYVADFLLAKAPQPPTNRQELRGMSMLAMARDVGYQRWRLPGLFWRGRNLMTQAIERVEPFAGIPEVIQKLHAEGHELFIVSSNNLRTLHAFLHHHGLHKYFLETYGGVGLFGKAPALRRLLKDQNLELNNAIYIGDELRDVEAAQSIGLRVIAVTWGFAREQDLVDQKPTALAYQPGEIISLLEEL